MMQYKYIEINGSYFKKDLIEEVKPILDEMGHNHRIAIQLTSGRVIEKYIEVINYPPVVCLDMATEELLIELNN